MIQSGLVYAAPRENELDKSENVCMEILLFYWTFILILYFGQRHWLLTNLQSGRNISLTEGDQRHCKGYHKCVDCYVMFKTRAAVFYQDLKPRGAAEWF